MKRLTMIALALALIFSLSVSSFAAFSDMPEGADGEVLQRAVDNGLLEGFEDGTVQPNTPITRAQMATIFARAMKAEEKADISQFVDVTPEDWYYEAMQKAVSMGAFKGDDLSRLNPNNSITRQEAFIVLYRIFNIPDSREGIIDNHSDGHLVADWARKETSALVTYCLEDVNYIRPLDPMTRLEFAQLMDKIVTTYIDKEGEYTSLPDGNVLIRANNVNLKGVVNNNTIYVGDGVTTMVNFDNSTCERVVIRGKRASFNSGQYGQVYAIGLGARVYITKNPFELVKTYADGTMGFFYAAPERAVLVPAIQQVTGK